MTLSLEIIQQLSNSTTVIGADECGFGSYAGPLVVCAVLVPTHWNFPVGLNDSKKLSKAKHKHFYEILVGDPNLQYKVEMAQAEEIDLVGVSSALRRCYQSTVSALKQHNSQALVIIDGQNQVLKEPHIALPKADGLISAVMAASVIGKYLHDQHMLELDTKYPGYGFATNVGYGTAKHEQAIRELGISLAHRKSYIPKRLSS